MSVTHPDAGLAAAEPREFTVKHPQLAPFLVALTIFIISAGVALTFTGLPS